MATLNQIDTLNQRISDFCEIFGVDYSMFKFHVCEDHELASYHNTFKVCSIYTDQEDLSEELLVEFKTQEANPFENINVVKMFNTAVLRMLIKQNLIKDCNLSLENKQRFFEQFSYELEHKKLDGNDGTIIIPVGVFETGTYFHVQPPQKSIKSLGDVAALEYWIVNEEIVARCVRQITATLIQAPGYFMANYTEAGWHYVPGLTKDTFQPQFSDSVEYFESFRYEKLIEIS
jgi:hypothetical protein